MRSGLPALTAIAEAKENIGPDTDTTSASLAHVLWALTHNAHFQDKLYRDLEKVGFSTDIATLEGIPRIRACVKEGVRWAGAAAAMLPRVMPQDGVKLHGMFLPEGISHHNLGRMIYAQTVVLTTADYPHVVTHLVPPRCNYLPQPRRVQSVPLDDPGYHRAAPRYPA